MSDDAVSYIGQLSQDQKWRWDGTAWTPAPVPLPTWASLKLQGRPTWTAVASAVVVGLAADQALRVGWFGLGASVALECATLALMLVGGLRRVESWLLAAAAGAFGAWLTVRASPWLLWPDVAAMFALLALAASIRLRGSLLDIGIAEAAARGVNAALHALAGVLFLARPIVGARSRVAAGAPVARGLLISIPIAVVLAGLLASADPIFASFLRINLDFSQLALDAVYVLAGALVVAGLLRVAAAEPIDRVDGPLWRLGTTEALVVLAVVDAIFGAFAIAQALAAGGERDALLTAGVTYADYARSGFFQLLWVAGITLVVLILCSRITGFALRKGRLAFTVLAEIAIALTLLIVLVASMRLSLYESAYGFTMLRLYSHIFAGWIAVVFLLLAADLAGLWSRRRWFVGATVITAIGLLMALNIANPEAIVVRLNIDRATATHSIDAQYLAGLSSDAEPALLASRFQVDASIQQDINTVACAGPRSYAPSPAAFNWADAAAVEARRERC
jgi:uncharacterized protein DUF4153